MTRDEALATWTHCRQVSRWKDNYSPEENDGPLARKLMPVIYKDAEITEIPRESLGLWPSAQYQAILKVVHSPAKPARPASHAPNAVMVPAEPEKCFYLAVRKEG